MNGGLAGAIEVDGLTSPTDALADGSVASISDECTPGDDGARYETWQAFRIRT